MSGSGLSITHLVPGVRSLILVPYAMSNVNLIYSSLSVSIFSFFTSPNDVYITIQSSLLSSNVDEEHEKRRIESLVWSNGT